MNDSINFKKKSPPITIKHQNSNLNLILKDLKSNHKKNSTITKYKIADFKFNQDNFSLSKVLNNKNGNLTTNESNLIFEKINEYLEFPDEFVKNNFQGYVAVEFHLNKKGRYLEMYTKIKGNSRYLNALVAKTLRQALIALKKQNLKLKKHTQIKALFHFKLTTSKKKLDKSKVLSDHMFFYRQKYGASALDDQIIKGAEKSLLHLTNWLSLLEYLPDSDKTKIEKNFKLKEYERDQFF